MSPTTTADFAHDPDGPLQNRPSPTNPAPWKERQSRDVGCDIDEQGPSRGRALQASFYSMATQEKTSRVLDADEELQISEDATRECGRDLRGSKELGDGRLWRDHAAMCSGTEAGSYLRRIDSCITQRKAQGPARTCKESKEEEKKHHAAGRKSVGSVLRNTCSWWRWRSWASRTRTRVWWRRRRGVAAFCLALSVLASPAAGVPGLRLEHPSEGFLFRAPPDAAAMDIVVAVRGVPDPAWPDEGGTEGLLRRWEPYTLVIELDGIEADRCSHK